MDWIETLWIGIIKNKLVRFKSEYKKIDNLQTDKSKSRLKKSLQKLLDWCKQIARGRKLLEDSKVMEKG